MTRTILFDLDGTLLPIDTDRFVYHYLQEVAAHAGHLVDPQHLTRQLMASTAVMIQNSDPSCTNAQVFAADFFPKVGRAEAELMPVFEAFYRERFPRLKEVCPGLPGLGRQIVQTALDHGYELVLATNPLFPRAAVEERMRWIGIDRYPWRLITTYEEMHFCKPQPAYYREVLDLIGRQPGECIMVGNDIEEDGAAAAVGIEVYLLTDYLVNRAGQPLPAERVLTIGEFYDKLRAGL